MLPDRAWAADGQDPVTLSITAGGVTLTGLAPVVLLYLVAGWSSDGVWARPVQTLKSVTEASDSSSQTRDVENYNLTVTMRRSPIFGSGFGHEYIEHVKMHDISAAFDHAVSGLNLPSLPEVIAHLQSRVLGATRSCGVDASERARSNAIAARSAGPSDSEIRRASSGVRRFMELLQLIGSGLV